MLAFGRIATALRFARDAGLAIAEHAAIPQEDAFMFRSGLIAAAVVGPLALVGCAVDSNQEIPEGLVLDAQSATHVSGSFGKEGVGLRFDLATRADGAHEAVLSDAAGVTLAHSVLTPDGIETMQVLGGRLTIRGKPSDPNPSIDGDRDALAELGQRSDAQLVSLLREGLAHEGVRSELYMAPAPPVRNRLGQTTVPTHDSVSGDISACSLGYNDVVWPGTGNWYATWSWWGWTNVRICAAWANNYPWGPYGTATGYIGNSVYFDGWHTVYDWAFCPSTVPSCPFYYQTAAQWWGFSVEVFNQGPDPMGVTTW